MKLYVGNLSTGVSSEQLEALFVRFGKLTSAEIVTDRQTGTSRGFGFVELPNETDARAAIAGLDGTLLDGQTLKVNEARPKREGTKLQ